MIEPLSHLKKLKVVGLFNNEIFNFEKALEIIAELVIKEKLTEISIDGNPISSSIKFKYSLIYVAASRLKVLDDDKIGELDHEIAIQYFD